MKKMMTGKKIFGSILGAILVFCGFMGMHMTASSAASGISCEMGTLTLTVEENPEGAFSKELSLLEIHVNIYKVADMTDSGHYTAKDGYEQLGLEDISQDTTAAFWQENAFKACEIAGGKKVDLEVVLQDGKVTTSLPAGLYLVCAESVLTPEYVYNFSPYLVSVPDNHYHLTGDDSWIYDVTAGLKPERSQRYGCLQIEKRLENYNATLAGAEFVFLIEAVLPKQQASENVDGLQEETVYSNVVSLSFDGPGNQSAMIDHLPANARVTVTEVYSGAGYAPLGASSVSNLIVAADDMIRAEFSNDYDYGGNGGHSVQNHYKAPEEGLDDWTWIPMKDNNG